jgi:hypothetical protein
VSALKESLRMPIPKLQYQYNQVFAGRNWNNGETVGGCCSGFAQWRRQIVPIQNLSCDSREAHSTLHHGS